MSEEKVTVEINDAPATSSKPEFTIDEAKESGLHTAEIEAGKKMGLFKESAKEPKAEEKEEVKADPKEEEKRKAENSDIRELVDKDLEPEDEAEAVKDFKPNEKALYWKFKKEKRSRQRLEAEVKDLRDKQSSGDKTQAVVEELRREIAALKAVKKAEDVEEEGTAEDDLDRPLTKRELMQLEQKRAEEYRQAQNEQQKRMEATRQRLDEESDKARTRYDDFDRVMELSAEVIKKADEFFPNGNPHRKKAEAVYKRLKYAMENPDQFSDDYGPADIAYELGELHPRFKSQSAPDSASSSGKQEPGLTPDQMERLKRNASRPPASASVSGGAGRRVVSEDDITPDMAVGYSMKEFSKLSPKTKARLLGAPN